MNLCELLDIPATDESEALLELLARAHRKAAVDNDNVSSMAARLMGVSGVSLEHAVAGAILTVGQRHAPIPAARAFIFNASPEMQERYIASGQAVPGWGNDFYKDSVDPAFEPVLEYIGEHHLEHLGKVDHVSAMLRAFGKNLFPNAAAFTATAAEIIGFASGLESLLLILFRLPCWGAQYAGVAK